MIDVVTNMGITKAEAVLDLLKSLNMGGHGNAEGRVDTAIAQYNKLVELDIIKESQSVVI